MGEEKKKFVAPKTEKIKIESRTAKMPIFKPKDEVSEECLAALRAAREVVDEKCEITGTPIEKRKRDPCGNVMGGLVGVIDALVVDQILKLSVVDHGFEVTKMQPENKEFTCFGIGNSDIGPDTWVEEPYQIKSETDIEFIRRELKRAIDAQKEILIKDANMMIRPLKITDFKVENIRFERFIETEYRSGVIKYDLEVKVKQLKFFF